VATQTAEIESRGGNDNGAPTEGDRRRLMQGIGVDERRLELAGVSTALIEGGEGPPIVLLHGPGEFAGKWVRVLPALLASHRVVAPDLPGHGASASGDGPLDADRVLDWLDQLIEECCPEPPVLVGHVLGGAIATRYAIANGHKLERLILVDTLGLARFRPAPRFAFTMVRFLRNPNERSYERFMRQCSLDFDGLREGMGERWDPFASYNLELARSPAAKAAGALMREVGLPRIPAGDLARIEVATDLIWGRQDRANRLAIAERASARYGWPLQVIDDCADDPARDRPEQFVQAIESALAPTPVA
jgi:pimeloyl-ACP methyl ester carboxylesterase